MRRDDRLAVTAAYQCEQRRDDQHALVARGGNQRGEPVRQRRNGRMALAGAAIGAVAVQKVVLQIAEDQRSRVGIDRAGSTIRLPSVSIRPA